DMKNLIGEASCRTYNKSFSTTVDGCINRDIYSEWIDECERVNNQDDEDAA
ncbi:Transcription elongation factor 1-like protein, partial [Thalictrum thalictroides]